MCFFHSPAAPEIDHSPGYTRYAARLGVRAQLICRSLASPQPSFIWRRHGKDLKMQRRNKFKSVERQVDTLNYESALLIENTSADDYGQYECVVRNALGQASTTLEFSKPSRAPFHVELMASGNPMVISYTWTKDGLPISSNSLSGQRLISDGPRLNISRLSRNDAGVYICEALNSQGTALLEVHVAVECE